MLKMRRIRIAAAVCAAAVAAAACGCSAAGRREQGSFGGAAKGGLPVLRTARTAAEENAQEVVRQAFPAEDQNRETVMDVPAEISQPGPEPAEETPAEPVKGAPDQLPEDHFEAEPASEEAAPQEAAFAEPAQPEPSGSFLDPAPAYAALAAFRQDPENLWLWNKEGTEQVPVTGLLPLSADPALEETARLRAKEQWEQFYINKTAAHTRPDGSSCFTVYPSGLSARGENLAWGHPDGASVINGWAESGKSYAGQAHRRNILDARFTRVGIACYSEDGRTCWAMCLGG